MEQTVEIKYWRRPWLNALAYSLLGIAALAGTQYESISQSIRSGYALKPVTVVFCISAFLYFLCLIFVMASRNLTEISVDGEQLLLKRRMGRAVRTDFRRAAIYRDKLYVNTIFSFRLNDIVNQEQLKDMLAKHIRVFPQDTPMVGKIAKMLVAIYLSVLIALLVLLFVFLNQPLAEILLWVFAGLFGGMSVGMLLYTVWSLALK